MLGRQHLGDVLVGQAVEAVAADALVVQRARNGEAAGLRRMAAVKGREDIMSTGIGKGVAIPHARDLTVTCIKIAVCLVREPLKFDSVDDLPVQLVFMIAVPQKAGKEYMKILRSLSEYLRNGENRNTLINATCERELYHDVLTIEEVITDSINA